MFRVPQASRDAALHGLRALDELLHAVHGVILSPARHGGVALGRHIELSEDASRHVKSQVLRPRRAAEALLAKPLGVCLHGRHPGLVEAQRHLHRRVHPEAVDVAARDQGPAHRLDRS